MRRRVKTENLIPHPQNDYYFDKMEESKWKDFSNSIRDNGLYEAPIVTPENLIVSGHERVRACLELGVDEIEVEVRDFADDNEILVCLIETNIQQRGSIGGSVIKMARRIQALERYYDVKRGNNGSEGGWEIISHPKTQAQLAEEMGMTARNLRIIRNLADLPAEFQEMVDEGKITPTTAAKLIVGLSAKEKEDLLGYLSEHDDSVKRFTESQISEYIAAIQSCETMIKDYQELSSGDNEDYIRIVEEKDRIREEAMRSLSELTHAQRQLKEAKKELAEAKKQAGLVDKVKQDLENTQNELATLKKNGTTHSQIARSLTVALSLVSGIAEAELAGKATQKETDKINHLVSSIEENLEAVRNMLQLGQSLESA